MPFDGDYSQEKYAQQMIEEYKAARIAPRRVFAQSFGLPDVLYWLAHEPAFGKQAVFLDARVDTPEGYEEAVAGMAELAAEGARIVAPPTFALLALDAQNQIVPSDYAVAAKAQGLDIITWTLERSGFLKDGGGYYYASVTPVIKNDGDMLRVLDVLAMQVGIGGHLLGLARDRHVLRQLHGPLRDRATRASKRTARFDVTSSWLRAADSVEGGRARSPSYRTRLRITRRSRLPALRGERTGTRSGRARQAVLATWRVPYRALRAVPHALRVAPPHSFGAGSTLP
jgi:hypothetical protein